MLVFFVIIFRGSSGEGQTSIISNFLGRYVEETSASIGNIVKSHNQLADINSLTTFNSRTFGWGGQEDSAIEPSPVQGNSFQAYNPVEEDYINIIEPKRSGVVEYTVQSGDALSFIASDYGVSMNSIIWANSLKDADSIKPGQTLKIPPVSGVIHEVKKGDTLASIAKKYGVSEDKIIEFNSLPKDGQLSLGKQLIVPDGQIKNQSTFVASSGSTSSVARFSYLPSYSGYYLLPTTGYDWGKIHGRNGVDIANSCGTPIFAAAEGSVSVADALGWNGGFGKYIKILHPNGTETLYAHNSKLLVEAGQYVTKGMEISLMGATGRSTGCHLHFEVHGAKNPLAKN